MKQTIAEQRCPLVEEFRNWMQSTGNRSSSNGFEKQPYFAVALKRFLIFELRSGVLSCDKFDSNLLIESLTSSMVFYINEDVEFLLKEMNRKFWDCYSEIETNGGQPPPHCPSLSPYMFLVRQSDAKFIVRELHGHLATLHIDRGVCLPRTVSHGFESCPDSFYQPEVWYYCCLPNNEVYNNNDSLHVMPESLAFSNCLSVFLQQKVVDIIPKRIPNWAKAKLQKRGVCEPPPVRLISLREVDRQRPDYERGESGREYYYRWLVRGHFRNQWFPSVGRHQMVWINHYIKGDEGAPLIETIRHVNR